MNRFTRLAFLPLSLVLTVGAHADTTTAADELTTLRANNKELSTELATAWKELDVVKSDLAAAQATAAKAADDSVALHKQLDAVNAAAPAPAAAPADDDLKKQISDLQAQVVTAQAAAKSSSDDAASLRKEFDDAKAAAATAAPAATPTPAAPVDEDQAKKDLADTQDKLSMSLHSYSLLQDENAQLKAQIAKDDSDKANAAAQLDAANSSIASLKVQAEIATQVDSLRTQLRQSQDEVASLAASNEQLRTKLALSSPLASNLHPTPLRPGSAPIADLTPTPIATATPAPASKTAAAADATGPRTYVVAEGDTLSKISKQFYGTSSRWDEIMKANHLKSDKSLTVGATLKIP